MEPIRILHIVGNMDAGGMETLIMNWYRTVDRKQVQFDFLVHSENKAFYEDEIGTLGGKIYHLSVLKDKNFFKYLRDLWRLFKDHPEYHVVHGHHNAFGPFYLLVAKLCGVKIRIAHSHTASFSKSIRGYLKFFITRFFGTFANVHLACSHKAGEYMFRGRGYSVINNGIDVIRFKYNEVSRLEIRNEFGISDSRFVVAHVGRFFDPKNHTFLVEIFAELLKKKPTAMLFLVGVGPLKDLIECKIKKLGIEKNVIFTGNRSDVEKILSASDVFLFPSLYEGLPLTVVEAQSSGLPIVCSDTITSETKLVERYKIISLKQTPEFWAMEINEFLNSPEERLVQYDIVRKKGYYSKDVAEKMQQFYLENY